MFPICKIPHINLLKKDVGTYFMVRIFWTFEIVLKSVKCITPYKIKNKIFVNEGRELPSNAAMLVYLETSTQKFF